jgi:hypothetical protein
MTWGFFGLLGKVPARAWNREGGTAHFDAMARFLEFVISFIVRILRAVIRSRANLVIENVALRQQVATL